MEFAADELSVQSGLMLEADQIHDLTLVTSSNFGGFSQQTAAMFAGLDENSIPTSEFSHAADFVSEVSVLNPDHIGSRLAGNFPQIGVMFGVDGESKPAKENAKPDQYWFN